MGSLCKTDVSYVKQNALLLFQKMAKEC